MATDASSRFRATLDSLASVAMLVAAIMLIGSTLGSRGPRTTGVGEDRAVVLPDQPVELTANSLLGSSSAPFVLLAFTDFQCPFCARFARDTLPRIEAEYISSGSLRFAYRHLPLEDIHPLALEAAAMVECAGEQERFWETHDFLFESTLHLSPSTWTKWVGEMKLDAGRLDDCRAGKGLEKVRKDMADARAWGVRVTPTFFIGRIGEEGKFRAESRLDGAVPFSEFEKVFAELLGRGR